MCEMKLFKIHEKLSDRSRSNSQISLNVTEKKTKITETETDQNKLVKVAGLFKKKRLGSKWQVEGQKW